MASKTITSFTSRLLEAKSIGIDSMIFLYHFANHKTYAPLTEVIFQLMESNKLHVVTSMVSVSEILVQAERKKDYITILGYEQFLQSIPNLEILPIDWSLARLAAKMRGTSPALRLPDALQLSAPLLKNYPLFVTNDHHFKNMKEIEVLHLDSYVG